MGDGAYIVEKGGFNEAFSFILRLVYSCLILSFLACSHFLLVHTSFSCNESHFKKLETVGHYSFQSFFLKIKTDGQFSFNFSYFWKVFSYFFRTDRHFSFEISLLFRARGGIFGHTICLVFLCILTLKSVFGHTNYKKYRVGIFFRRNSWLILMVYHKISKHASLISLFEIFAHLIF